MKRNSVVEQMRAEEILAPYVKSVAEAVEGEEREEGVEGVDGGGRKDGDAIHSSLHSYILLRGP